MWDIATKILLVAITVAFLGAWGIIKQQRKSKELISQLFNKSEKKVLNTFKTKDKLTIKEIEKIIKGTKASLFWSKERIQITDPSIAATELIDKMRVKGLIIEEIFRGKKIYKLR